MDRSIVEQPTAVVLAVTSPGQEYRLLLHLAAALTESEGWPCLLREFLIVDGCCDSLSLAGCSPAALGDPSRSVFESRVPTGEWRGSKLPLSVSNPALIRLN